jgi:Ser/Thr protein kinase RdoA (MazF antagonist)
MSSVRAMSGPTAADWPAVFAHFGAAPSTGASLSPYAPVFRCRTGGRDAVLKRTRGRPGEAAAVAAVTRQWRAAGVPVVTPLELAVPNPARIGDQTWVAYPYVDGRPYAATAADLPADLAAAGDLLGRLHAAGGPARMPAFAWPDHDAESVAEDVAAIKEVVGAHAPGAVARLTDLVSGFMARELPAIRDAGLPGTNTSMDYKAVNLVYPGDGPPVLVDPDNGDHAPRLLDLALAVLLFHIEHPHAPPRLFTPAEWSTFVGGYLRHVTLTGQERRLWPTALAYLLSEYGVWSLTSDPRDWRDPRSRTYLRALAEVDLAGYPLP